MYYREVLEADQTRGLYKRDVVCTPVTYALFMGEV